MEASNSFGRTWCMAHPWGKNLTPACFRLPANWPRMKAFNTIFQEFQAAKDKCFSFPFCSFILCFSASFVFQSSFTFCLWAQDEVTCLVGLFLCSFIFVFCIVFQVFSLMPLPFARPMTFISLTFMGLANCLTNVQLGSFLNWFALLASFCNVMDIKILGVFFGSNFFSHLFFKRFWVICLSC